MFGSPLYWRETHRQPRFLLFDGRVVGFFLLTLMHARVWTLLLSLTAIGVLYYFERKRVSPDSIARFLRARLVGHKRSARGPQNERPAVDFGFETSVQIRNYAAATEARGEAIMKSKAKKPSKKG